jgi:hypothetical protein
MVARLKQTRYDHVRSSSYKSTVRNYALSKQAMGRIAAVFIGYILTIVTLFQPGAAFAQSESGAASANISPAAVSLFLLVIGLIGIGIVAARGVDPSTLTARFTPRNTSAGAGAEEEDGLVADTVPAQTHQE